MKMKLWNAILEKSPGVWFGQAKKFVFALFLKTPPAGRSPVRKFVGLNPWREPTP